MFIVIQFEGRCYLIFRKNTMNNESEGNDNNIPTRTCQENSKANKENE